MFSNQSAIERMAGAECPDALRILDEVDGLFLSIRHFNLRWPIAKPPEPVSEIAATHAALEPEKVSESQSVEDDVEGGGQAAIDIASGLHRGFLSFRSEKLWK